MKWLTEKQVAEMTGISLSSLQKARSTGKGAGAICFTRIGSCVRYRLDDVVAHMNAGRVESGRGRAA